jgi:Tol biopolymer transport system component
VILASDRPGGTAGSSDLYQATRPDLDAGFGSLTRLELLASSGDDADPTLSADQRYMVFMSDRAGSQDLYEVSR